MKRRVVFILIVLVSGLTATMLPKLLSKPTEPPKAVEVKPTPVPEAAKDDQDEVAGATIQPTVTNTPSPTSKATQTPTPTATVKPTPTTYLRYPNPSSKTEEMANRICLTFGEKDCMQGIALATKFNPYLKADFSNQNQQLGLFAIRCSRAYKLLGIDSNLPAPEREALCREKLFDAQTSINLVYNYFKSYGYASTQAWIM